MVVKNLLTQGSDVDMSVYLRSLDVLVPQHLLDGSQVGTALKQRRGKRVAQRVWRHRLFPDFVTFLRHVCKCLIIKGRYRRFG